MMMETLMRLEQGRKVKWVEQDNWFPTKTSAKASAIRLMQMPVKHLVPSLLNGTKVWLQMTKDPTKQSADLLRFNFVLIEHAGPHFHPISGCFHGSNPGTIGAWLWDGHPEYSETILDGIHCELGLPVPYIIGEGSGDDVALSGKSSSPL
jgi:hypothetical protein